MNYQITLNIYSDETHLALKKKVFKIFNESELTANDDLESIDMVGRNIKSDADNFTSAIQGLIFEFNRVRESSMRDVAALKENGWTASALIEEGYAQAYKQVCGTMEDYILSWCGKDMIDRYNIKFENND